MYIFKFLFVHLKFNKNLLIISDYFFDLFFYLNDLELY